MLSAISHVAMPTVAAGQIHRHLTVVPLSVMGCYKVNSDGSRRVEGGLAACRGLIRDPVGEWVLGYAKAIGVCLVVDAELWGIYIGLAYAWDLHIRRVIVETDCLEALRLLKVGSNGQVSPDLVLHVLELCHRPWDVSLRQLKRDANRDADQMAKLVIFDGLDVSTFQVPTHVVGHLLHANVGD
ncbi:hypothetical protein V6N11_054289 [Hibiscus sabdariffa]|uniref:RNase H type-1 domain-containing protein n=1 Tax=Hibiscus sabdariffa TaxID=183260 RepID=A0ABR2S3F6_9ROSI